jgi:hypothetical protein
MRTRRLGTRTSRAGPPELAICCRQHAAPVLQARAQVLVQHVVDRGVGHHDQRGQHALPEALHGHFALHEILQFCSRALEVLDMIYRDQGNLDHVYHSELIKLTR